MRSGCTGVRPPRRAWRRFSRRRSAKPPTEMADQAASVAGLAVDNVRGARWMIASSIAFAISTSVIKYVARDLPAAEIAFFRCFFGLSVIAPFIMRHGWGIYRTTRADLHLFRVACAVGGLIMGFYSVAHLPL